MKTLFTAFAMVFLLIVLQQFATSTMASVVGSKTIFTSTSLSGDESASKSNDSQLERIDQDYQRKINYIIVIVFAVLFSAGIYWWTYGKLHHKLPRY